MKLKNISKLIVALCLVLLFITDIMFYQQQEGRLITILLGLIGSISGVITMLTDEEFKNEDEDDEEES